MNPTARMMYASPEGDADVLYATRFPAPDPVLWFRVRGRDHLLLSDLEYGRGLRVSRVDRVHRFSEWGRRAGVAGPLSIAEGSALFLKSHGVRRVEVPASFPLILARNLSQKGIRVDPVPDPFFPERSRKRPFEVAAIRRALRATEAAIRRVEDVLRRSRVRNGVLRDGGRLVTSESLRALLKVTLAAQGLTARHTITACGRDACDPHSQGHGPVRSGQAIVLDVFPRSDADGYWADITRTFVKGRPTPALVRQYEAVRAAQEAALGRLRAGRLACDVHQAAVEAFESRGFFNSTVRGAPRGFIHGLGHGVGLEIHEAPRLNASSKHRMAAGEVVTIEPGFYDPGVGGVRLEDMVLVTAKGCENLTRYPKRFVIP